MLCRKYDVVLLKDDLVYRSFVIFEQTTDVHLIFFFRIVDMIRKMFQTMKLSKFDFPDTICNVYLDKFVLSMYINCMWLLDNVVS